MITVLVMTYLYDCCTSLGVFQTLVEKHFPAPDRNRIQRLLGIENPSNSKKVTNGNDEGNSSSGKRKPSEFEPLS